MEQNHTMRTECAVTFQKINDNLEFIKKSISGDEGFKSILNDHKKILKDHDVYIQQQIGRNKFIIGALGGGWFITIILLILQLFSLFG